MSGPDDRNVAAPARPASPAPVAAPQTPTTSPTAAAAAAAAAPGAPRPSFFNRHKKALIVALLILAAIAIAIGLVRFGRSSAKDQNQLTLYGNVDLRQVELAFNNSERISEVLVQEGDKVTRGQILARLDTSRLKPETATVEAEMEAQQAVVLRLHHGSRPEDIAQARGNVASAKADQVNAEQNWQRMMALTSMTTGRGISQQEVDSAKAALDTARARLAVAEEGFDLAKIGPRTEDIAQGRGATARQSGATRALAATTWRTLNSLPLAMP